MIGAKDVSERSDINWAAVRGTALMAVGATGIGAWANSWHLGLAVFMLTSGAAFLVIAVIERFHQR